MEGDKPTRSIAPGFSWKE